MLTKGLKTIFRLLIGAAGIALVVLLALGLVILLGWPAWTVIVVLAGFCALGLGGFWLYKARLRKKEEWFIKELSSGPTTEAEGVKQPDIQAKWKEAIETLRRSHLKKYGNPLYVLPWYMVIGRSAAGKTTAIKNAHLSSPFASPSPTATPGSTVDCDWWFFDQAVILDMAGRYAIGTEADAKEWKDFLGLLAKYKKHEPINGLIVAVSVEDLEGLSQKELESQALTLRTRLDELMQTLGVRFPVYVVVTKCDLIQGMVPLMEQLPDSKWKEVLGISRPLSDTRDIRAFVHDAMDHLKQNLRELRNTFLGNGRGACSFLLLPEEFVRLEGPLSTFLGALFKQTPYHDQPLFRGLYFTSARQQGRPFSKLLTSLGLPAIEQKTVSEKSGFLHDFFAKVLINDRALLAPTKQALSWKRLTQNLGLSVWVLTGLVLCGLLTLSFINNIGAMRLVNREMPVELRLGDDLFQNIRELGRYRNAVERLHERNQGWWAPKMGLGQSEALEKKLGGQFVTLYQKYVLWPLEEQMGKQLKTVDASTPRAVVAGWVDLLARRIRLINASLEGQDSKKLRSLKSPDYAFMLRAALGEKGQRVPENLAKTLADIDLTYLLFEKDREPLTRLSRKETGRLKAILHTEGVGLSWLPDWANRQVESLEPVTYSMYWGGNPDLENRVGPEVQRAYTPEGFEKIQGFINEISTVLYDPETIKAHKDAFYKVYRREYWEAWGRFLTSFPNGWRLWSDRTGRREIAARMSGEQSPYRRLLQDLEGKIAPAGSTDAREPAWALLLARYSRIMNNPEYRAVLDTEGKGLLKKMMKGGTNVYTWLQKNLKGEEVSQAFRKDRVTFRHTRAYDKAIDSFAHQVLTPKGAFEAASKAFEEGYAGMSEPASPGLAAFYHAAQLKKLLGQGKKDEAPFWALIDGPPDYVWHFALSEAGRQIEGLWQQKVVSEIQGLSDREAIETLIGQRGKVWAFTGNDLKYFLTKSRKKGYGPRVLFQGQIPFSPEFFNFLARGRRASQALRGTFQIHLDALPTDASRGAKYKPHLTRLALKCTAREQELLNFNYPVGADFKWNADGCQEVNLEIKVGDLTLKKIYHGFDAFPRFLRDFSKGTKSFKPEDFPSQSAKLRKDYRIKAIKVRYRMRGQRPLLSLLEIGPGNIPGKIIAERPFEATFTGRKK